MFANYHVSFIPHPSSGEIEIIPMKLSKCRSQRRGSMLVLTLIVVAMLTLGAAAFFERMFAEHQAERTHGRQLQASQLAESGVEYMKVLLSRDPAQIQQLGGLYNNSSLFQGVVV